MAGIEQLGQLQQDIIKHIFECKNEGVESVSHISRALNALQPAVHRSVKALEKDGYLIKEKQYTGRVKGVTLTSKGAAAAFLLGASPGNKRAILKINENYKKLMRYSLLGAVPLDRNDTVLKEAMRFILQAKSDDDWRKRRVEVFAQILEGANQPQAMFDNGLKLKQIVEKYGMEKEELREIFEQRRQQLDSLIAQLK
jgi:DNA-binding MarR family transcriptional regulator